ncbi:hypothetical protein OG785_35655 [Streptomyces sp. NBC_00006]|uniref:hypothetical protein n=1 Tax=Streptomyces sp. NBC_00006 TaxID=2975619 RepID=UPI002252F747|nr:hypothetical protein [Streptomyces sp. NBC_00006]MCX5535878.1 hypothetical protein [Streptomyces sp. NBC_00006]
MLTVPSVSLARESSSQQSFLVVGDTKFPLLPGDFPSLGLNSLKMRVVEDGTLSRYTERRFRADPAVRATDVFFGCPDDFESITGKWHYNCQQRRNLVYADALVAGWLWRPNGDTPAQPYINQYAHGIEDIHYEVRYDSVFMDRMYGPGGLSSALTAASYPGNPAGDQPRIPFPAGPPFAGTSGRPTTVTLNSWILPGNAEGIHGELNSWHVNNTGGLFTRHFVGRGPAPAGWVNPFGSDTGACFPFHPYYPDGRGPLRTGDYVLLRGPLWEDCWHGDPATVLDPWDTPPTRHHAWLEMHPIDWVVKFAEPGPNLRTGTTRCALCTPGTTGNQADWAVSVRPDFPPSSGTRRIEVRDVRHLEDLRNGMINRSGVRTVTTQVHTDHVDAAVSVAPTGGEQGRYKGCWIVDWRELDSRDRVWVDDQLPAGAQPFADADTWLWTADPKPFHGAVLHRSARADGGHQHYFLGATQTLQVAAADVLFAYVLLDPDTPPDEIMLQWRTTEWLHRAYWGADRLPWGTPGTTERRHLGPLPPSGEWIRLDIPAPAVGLGGAEINGMAFTLWGGAAVWDYAGVWSPIPKSGVLRATVNPANVLEGQSTVTVLVHDSGDGSPVAGRVLLEGSDVGATNTRITETYDPGYVTFTARCPGYADATAKLRVRKEPKPPPDRAGGQGQ